MAEAIIDVREWQTRVDFATGRRIDNSMHPLIRETGRILAENPFPGDMDMESVSWVINTALELYNMYQPRFMMLNIATPFFKSIFQAPALYNRTELADKVFSEIERFTSLTGMFPVIAGTGDTTPLKGEINLAMLDGLVNCAGMGPVYAGVYDPSSQDLDFLLQHDDVELVMAKSKLISEWGGTPDFIKRLPDYLLVARKGYIFRAYGSMSRTFYQIPSRHDYIPLLAPDKADSITDIAGMVRKLVADKPVALIVAEGLGEKDFPAGYKRCRNTLDWYSYVPGDGFYLALSTGQHLPYHQFPPGYRYYLDDGEDKLYPFSGPYREMPSRAIGHTLAVRSAAVGNRSIMTHVASGADISVECFARGLYNYGSMAVIN